MNHPNNKLDLKMTDLDDEMPELEPNTCYSNHSSYDESDEGPQDCWSTAYINNLASAQSAPYSEEDELLGKEFVKTPLFDNGNMYGTFTDFQQMVLNMLPYDDTQLAYPLPKNQAFCGLISYLSHNFELHELAYFLKHHMMLTMMREFYKRVPTRYSKAFGLS